MASITKRPNGAYRARYRDDMGKEHARHFARKADARRWLDEVTASVLTGAYVDPGAGKVTFDAFFGTWAARQVWVFGSARAMELVRQSVPFGDVPLAQLRASHLEAWVKAMSAKGLAPQTITTRVNGVRSVLRAAVRDRLIPADPSQGITVPRRRRAEHSMTIPTPAQVGAILAAAPEHQRPLWALGAFAGLRLGEACGLQVGDVDFLRRQLRVTRQVQRAREGLEVRLPKYGSERVVYLPDGLLDLLAAHVATFGRERTDWLVPAPSGGPLPPSTANGWWTAATRKAGVAGVHTHALRHFYASGLIAQGCDVVTVQRALGHSAPSTTLNTYSHLWPNAEDRTRAAADAMFTAALADPLRTEAVLEAR